MKFTVVIDKRKAGHPCVGLSPAASHAIIFHLGFKLETIMKQARIIGAGGCLAVLLFTGCAGVSPNSANSLGGVTPPGTIDVHSTRPLSSPFSGESLTGTRRHVRIVCQSTKRGYRGKFRASGVASGPYPGSFTAHGRWQYKNGYFDGYTFNEWFTISSGKRTFNGRMSGYGNGSPGCPNLSITYNLTFEIEGRNWTGNSTAAISKESLSESFL
jgi:hypothetical protein